MLHARNAPKTSSQTTLREPPARATTHRALTADGQAAHLSGCTGCLRRPQWKGWPTPHARASLRLHLIAEHLKFQFNLGTSGFSSSLLDPFIAATRIGLTLHPNSYTRHSMKIVAIALAIHFVLGLAICAGISAVMKRKLGLGALLLATFLTSTVSLVSCVLVFLFLPPFNTMPGGLMEGGVVTLALFFAVFTSVYFFTAAMLCGCEIVRSGS
jgi:hypothetical protein